MKMTEVEFRSINSIAIRTQSTTEHKFNNLTCRMEASKGRRRIEKRRIDVISKSKLSFVAIYSAMCLLCCLRLSHKKFRNFRRHLLLAFVSSSGRHSTFRNLLIFLLSTVRFFDSNLSPPFVRFLLYFD